MENSSSATSNIKIPSEQIFKIHYLDYSGTENKIILFANSNQPFNLNEIFSEDEIVNINLKNIEVVFSSQQIYTDDTIRTIKKKIITEIGKNVISYPELYLFSKVDSDTTLFQIYTSITRDNKIPFTHVMLGQLLTNLGIDDKEILDKIPIQDSYTYIDLTKYLSDFDGKQELWKPVGPKFTNNNIDYLFQANPYNILNADNNPFYPSNENPLISFENNVLLSYGDLMKNVIYATSVSDVLEYAKTIQLDDEYVIPLYFPLLEKSNVFTGNDVVQNKQKLLAENDKLYDKSFIKVEENLHTVYDLYNNNSRDDIKYSQNGIQFVDFTIHPQSKIKLPLDVLFKNMHATKKIPFIKYNPGARFEKMYRAYSEDITKTGQQIPFLSKSNVMNYSKNIGKVLQISLVVQSSLQNKVFDVIISINQNGNIDVLCDFSLKELETPRNITMFALPSVTELENYLKDIVNDTIETLNTYISNLGYKLQKFSSFNHNNVEIKNIHYKLWSPLTQNISLNENYPCLTNMFEIQEVEKDAIQMRFKRVNNYTQMNAINSMITETYKRSNNEREVVNALMMNYDLTEQQALLEFTKYLNDFTQINGQYVNKNIDIVESPGFSVELGKLQTGLILHIDVTQITDIRYIGLLNIYFESFLRVSQNIGTKGISKTRINQLCSKKYDSVKEPTIENIIIPNQKIVNPIVDTENIDIEEDDDEDEDDEDGILFMDDDEDDDEDEDDEVDYDAEGGAKLKSKSKAKITDPRKYLFDKLKMLEPDLILSKPMGNYKAFSRACPSNIMRQPVILTNEEKTQIDKKNRNAYNYALRYGSNKENPHWFICPRYWCLDNNQPLTKTQVDSGVCSENVFEFTDPRYHVDKDGKYVHHKPGFLPNDTHPKYGVPCCFSKDWNSSQLEERRTKWGITNNDIDLPKGTNWEEIIDGTQTELTGVIEAKDETIAEQTLKSQKQVARDITTVKYFSNLSLFETPGSWVFLPRSVQLFMDVNYQNVLMPENQQKIKNNQIAYLLYTVERKYKQSFIGCLATIYADMRNVSLPSINEMRNIIADSITLDMFLQYHNGSLVSTFQPKRFRVNNDFLNQHHNSLFYQSLDEESEQQMDFYESTVASFQKFLEYLRDDDSWIDYVYLWDIITMPNPGLFTEGLNLVILSVTDNDITDNVEVICPTNSHNSKIFNRDKNTLILVEQNEYYAIVSQYDNTENNSIKRTSTFKYETNLPQIKQIMKKIQNTNKYCKPLPSMPKEYKYKQNLTANNILDILNQHDFIVDYQISNYRGKNIGFMIRISDENTNTLFIPSSPSSIVDNIKVKYMDNIDWNDYVTTRDLLTQISENTEGKILCKPLLKIVEDELIVGILTETNQVLQINPPIPNDIDDGIDIIKVKGYNDYYKADKQIQTVKYEDKQRYEVVRNIRLETQFYSSFKTTIRILLNDPSYITLRDQLLEVINNNRYLYRIKLQKIEILIKHLVRNTVSFDDIDENVLKSIENVDTCTNNKTPYCIVKNNNYQLSIPSKNLITGIDNEKLYFARIADELVRYKRVRLFMMEPKKYLNIGTVDYKVNPDEVILLQSVLTDEYWENMEPFYMNSYISNLNYDNADPNVSQKYSSEVSLKQQDDAETEGNKKETGMLCIKDEKNEVIGNNNSKWKKIFPSDSRETIFTCSRVCGYNLIKSIYNTHFNQNITIDTLKNTLISQYNHYIGQHKSKIFNILRKQNGKNTMIKRVEQNKMTLEDLIISEEYYITNLDMWVLASYYKLPIMLFSQSPLENLHLNVDWVLFGGNYEKDKIFFIRSPAISTTCPEYKMVTPERPLYDLNGFVDVFENSENYINNIMDFESYLNQVSLVFE